MRIRWKSRRGQRKEATWVSRPNWRRWSQQAENISDESSFAIPCNINSRIKNDAFSKMFMMVFLFKKPSDCWVVCVWSMSYHFSTTTTFKSGFVEFVNWKNSSMEPEPEWEPGPLSNNTLEGICGQGRCCQSCLCRTSSTNTNTNTFFWNYKYLLLKTQIQIPSFEN